MDIFISTVDTNNTLTKLTNTRLPTKDLSSFVSFINDNEKVINFQVNISKLIDIQRYGMN